MFPEKKAKQSPSHIYATTVHENPISFVFMIGWDVSHFRAALRQTERTLSKGFGFSVCQTGGGRIDYDKMNKNKQVSFCASGSGGP